MRKHPRIPVIMLVQGEGFPLPICFTKDISRGGLYLETVTPLSTPEEAVGKELNLSFCLPYSTRSVKARARIVRIKDENNFENKPIHGLGVEFVSPGPELLGEIDHYIQQTTSQPEDSLAFMALPNEEVLEATDDTSGPYFAFKGIEYYDAAVNRLLAAEGEAPPAEEHPHLAVIREICSRLSAIEKAILLRRDDHFSSLPDGDRKFLLELLLHLVKLECEALLMPKYLTEGGRYSRQLQSEALKSERELLQREQRENELYQRLQKGKEIRLLGEYEKIRQHYQRALRLFRENVIQRGEESLFEEAMPPELKKLFDSVEAREVYEQLLIDYHSSAELGRIERAKVAKFLSGLEPFEVAILSGEVEMPEHALLVRSIALYWKLGTDFGLFSHYPGNLYLFRKKVSGIYQRSAEEAVDIQRRLAQLTDTLDAKKDKERRRQLDALHKQLQGAEGALGNLVNRINAQGEAVPGVETFKERRPKRRFHLFGAPKEEKRVVAGRGKSKAVKPRSIIGRTLFLITVLLALSGFHFWPQIKAKLRGEIRNVDFPVPLVLTEVVNDEARFTVNEAELDTIDPKQQREALEKLLSALRGRGYEGLHVYNENGRRLYVTYHRGDEVYLAKVALAEPEKGTAQERDEKVQQMKVDPEGFMKTRRVEKKAKKEAPSAGSRFNIPGFIPPPATR